MEQITPYSLFYNSFIFNYLQRKCIFLHFFSKILVFFETKNYLYIDKRKKIKNNFHK